MKIDLEHKGKLIRRPQKQKVFEAGYGRKLRVYVRAAIV
jgi:hypothetical protein